MHAATNSESLGPALHAVNRAATTRAIARRDRSPSFLVMIFTSSMVNGVKNRYSNAASSYSRPFSSARKHGHEWLVTRSRARRQLPIEPGLCQRPFALHGRWRNAERFGRLVDREPAEESQLHDSTLPRDARGQHLERLV